MNIECRAYYKKNEDRVHSTAKTIEKTMTIENVQVALINKSDILEEMGLRSHQGAMAITILNKAFITLDIEVSVASYNRDYILMLADPIILNIWSDADYYDEEDDDDVMEIEDDGLGDDGLDNDDLNDDDLEDNESETNDGVRVYSVPNTEARDAADAEAYARYITVDTETEV